MLAATNGAVFGQGLKLTAVVVTGIVALGIPLAVGIAATLNDGTAVISKQTFFQFLVSLGVSEATYLKIWKPAGVYALAPDFGFGSNTTPRRVPPNRVG
jgi:hypothetical protein